MKRLSLAVVVLLALIASAAAQTPPNVQSTVALFQNVRTVANVVYLRANGWEGKLDVYAQRTQTSTPVVIYIHGGGWVRGTKDGSVLSALPYLAMGYSVVNVEYRLADVSLAPAAIEDCRCALRWVVGHAKDYNFDVGRIVIAGASAGGHLALTTGMIPTSAGFDRICQEQGEPRIAAIVDFFGITDVADLLDGPNKKPFPETWPYTVQWLGNQANRDAVAKAASPLTYVRAGVPPTIAIHGDADPLVPYAHSTRLNDALQKAGVAHELVTVPGGGHGNFSLDQWQRAYTAIEKFLGTHVTASKSTASSGK
ncbi:MAG: alpha/beta hydrolase [Acidobacteria bacterium]|nr:MAG: alpha/beta hydrolase [Acidobacteriota bacterium]